MKKIAMSLAIAAPFAVQAETIEIEKPVFYGKFNVTQEFVQQENAGNYSQLNSNNSRLGVKGNVDLEHGLTGIYQAEFGVNADAKGDSSDNAITRRNTFIGVEGRFGQVKAGVFDSPLKNAQNKVDQFNDLQGDIGKIITNSDNRTENNVQYTSPAMAGLVLTVDHINSEDEEVNNGLSSSLTYTHGGIYVAYAYDTEVEGEGIDVSRLAAQYAAGAVQVGALWESEDNNGSSNEGWIASAAYKLSAVTLKAQYGESDIKEAGAVTYSLGADYKLSKPAKVFVYATNQESDTSDSAQYYGAGLEYKF